jgi:ribosomal protein S18 acetylase RimI-like enzyme
MGLGRAGRAEDADRRSDRRQLLNLVVVGVRPEAQRRGLGTLLMQRGLGAADRDRTPVYLETADRANIAYYERFGFAVVDRALELVPGGPAHVAMWRPADG